eukprot:802744_1
MADSVPTLTVFDNISKWRCNKLMEVLTKKLTDNSSSQTLAMVFGDFGDDSFTAIDSKKDGVLDEEEISIYIQSCGISADIAKQKALSLIKSISEDETAISKQDWVRGHISRILASDHVQKAQFDKIDTNQTGVITLPDIKSRFQEYGVTLNDLKSSLKQYAINFKEFQRAIVFEPAITFNDENENIRTRCINITCPDMTCSNITCPNMTCTCKDACVCNEQKEKTLRVCGIVLAGVFALSVLFAPGVWLLINAFVGGNACHVDASLSIHWDVWFHILGWSWIIITSVLAVLSALYTYRFAYDDVRHFDEVLRAVAAFVGLLLFIFGAIGSAMYNQTTHACRTTGQGRTILVFSIVYAVVGPIITVVASLPYWKLLFIAVLGALCLAPGVHLLVMAFDDYHWFDVWFHLVGWSWIVCVFPAGYNCYMTMTTYEHAHYCVCCAFTIAWLVYGAIGISIDPVYGIIFTVIASLMMCVLFCRLEKTFNFVW